MGLDFSYCGVEIVAAETVVEFVIRANKRVDLSFERWVEILVEREIVVVIGLRVLGKEIAGEELTCGNCSEISCII